MPQSDTDQSTKRGIGSWVRITDFRKFSVSVFGIEGYPDYSLLLEPLGDILHRVPVLRLSRYSATLVTLVGHGLVRSGSKARARTSVEAGRAFGLLCRLP